MRTTLTPDQEAIVVELRTTLLLPTDDLLAVTREFINPDVSRAGLDRCLRRHGVSKLTDLVANETDEPAQKKTFKDYEPRFIHIDIKYLPQMPGETTRPYLFVAIDRETRWVFMEIYSDQTAGSSVDFLSKVRNVCPVKIIELLTDNGSQFTDRFTSKKKDLGGNRVPTGKHVFDRLCKQFDIAVATGALAFDGSTIGESSGRLHGIRRHQEGAADVVQSKKVHAGDLPRRSDSSAFIAAFG